jgi:hypothetical protein
LTIKIYSLSFIVNIITFHISHPLLITINNTVNSQIENYYYLL